MKDKKLEARFHERKRGFLKKLYELKTLCGIDACAIIISDRRPSVQTWPEDRAEVRRLALQYKSKLLSARVSGGVGPKKKSKNRKPRHKSMSDWRRRITRLASLHQLDNLGAGLDSNIQEIDRRRQDILRARGKKDRPPPETQHSGDLTLLPPPTETSLVGPDMLCVGDLDDANGDVRYLLPPPPETDHAHRDSLCLRDLDANDDVILCPPTVAKYLPGDSMCLGDLDAFYRNMGASAYANGSALYLPPLPPPENNPADDSLCSGDLDAFWGNFCASSGDGGSLSRDLIGAFSCDLASSSGYLGAFSGHSDDFSGVLDADGWVLASGQPAPLAVETDLAGDSFSSAAATAAAADDESPKPPTPTSNIDEHLSISNPWIQDLRAGSEIQMIATPMWRGPNLSCTAAARLC